MLSFSVCDSSPSIVLNGLREANLSKSVYEVLIAGRAFSKIIKTRGRCSLEDWAGNIYRKFRVYILICFLAAINSKLTQEGPRYKRTHAINMYYTIIYYTSIASYEYKKCFPYCASLMRRILIYSRTHFFHGNPGVRDEVMVDTRSFGEDGLAAFSHIVKVQNHLTWQKQ